MNVSRHRLLSFGLNDYASKVDSRFRNGCGYLLVMAIAAVFLTAADQTRAEQSSQESTGEKPVGSESANEVARELANPNTPLASLTLKNQITFFEGDLPGADDEMSGTLLFQPALPFPLSNGDKIIFRPAIPLLVEQSIFDPAGGGDFDSKTGLGDIAFDLAYAKSLPSGLLMAGGLISALPTATRGDLGREQWTLGPEILFGFISEKYLLAIFPSHQWDIAGSGNEDMDVSLTTIQAFAVGLPGGGWNVGSQPIILYDHESEEWTVPLNLQVGRTLVVGDRPWKFAFEVNYYVERPGSFGPEWMIGFNITPVVANRLADFASGLFGK